MYVEEIELVIKQLEDTKGAIRSRNRTRTDSTMAKRKSTNGQTTMYKSLHRKLKIMSTTG
jgi:hypothetical protein